MFITKFILISFYLMLNKSVYAKKLEEIFTCVNETGCDELIEKDILEESTTVENIYNTTINSIYSTQSTKFQIITKQMPQKIKYNKKSQNQNIYKMHSDICECDLMVNFYHILYSIY